MQLIMLGKRNQKNTSLESITFVSVMDFLVGCYKVTFYVADVWLFSDVTVTSDFMIATLDSEERDVLVKRAFFAQ
jgi:hypothetical protein